MKHKKTILAIATLMASALAAYQQKYEDSNTMAINKNLPSHIASNQQHSTSSTMSKVKSGRQKKNYNKALRILWTDVYPHLGETLYCNVKFSTDNRKERKKIVNAEHVYPMSWITRELKCGSRKECHRNSEIFREIESDLHNIYPALIEVNKARSNFRFGDIPGEKREFGQCDFEVDQRKRIAEPMPAKRGEVARAMLYVAYQYNLPLHRKTNTLMKLWDKQDPPSKEEHRREIIIHQRQGIENPFISRHPFKG